MTDCGLKYMRSLWVAAVSGGPFEYTGKNLADAHLRFRIKPEEFDEVAAEFRRALEYYKVPEREKEETMYAFIAHRDKVTTGSRIPTVCQLDPSNFKNKNAKTTLNSDRAAIRLFSR